MYVRIDIEHFYMEFSGSQSKRLKKIRDRFDKIAYYDNNSESYILTGVVKEFFRSWVGKEILLKIAEKNVRKLEKREKRKGLT